MRDPLSWVPIKFKLPLAFVCICLVAFGVGGYVVTQTAQRALGEEIRVRLDERASATRMVVGQHLDLLGRRAEDFASDGFIRSSLVAIQRGDTAAIERLRQHLVVNKLPLVGAFVDAAVLGRDGAAVVEVHGGAQGAATETTTYSPVHDPNGHDAKGRRDYRSFSVSTPLRDLAGTGRIGTLVLQVHADNWVEGMVELRELPSGHADSVEVRSPGGSTLRLSGGEMPADSISYESTIPESGWSVIVAVDRAAISAPMDGLRDRFAVIAAVLLALTAMVLFFPVRFLLAPLGQIGDAARRMAAGDFSIRVGYKSRDEIGDLSRAFDVMAEAVEERTIELEQREASIRYERDRLDAVLRSMRDGLFTLDEHGDVTYANEAAKPLVQTLAESGSAFKRSCGHAPGEHCLDCLRTVTLPRHTCTLEADGRVYEVHVTEVPGESGHKPGRLCVSRDVTERVAQTKVQAHQERMNVLGNISAVMAHELNNPLAAIAMFSQMLETQLESGSAERESAEVIRRNAETCKRTIRGLLDTAVHAPPERVEFELDELVDDVRRFLRPIWQRADVEFEVEHQQRPLDVQGDELQLRQVLINLVMNAVQAMDSTGRVTVRTALADPWFEVEVCDTGPGIPEKLQRTIFEPFFTTKPPSVGTGLGLSTSRRIVAAHGGTLELSKTGPNGTTFRISLPVHPAAVEPSVGDPLRV